MKSIENKVLILGGKPIGSFEITQRLKERGAYTVVTDFLSSELSFAKKIADESWMDSTADIEVLAQKIFFCIFRLEQLSAIQSSEMQQICSKRTILSGVQVSLRSDASIKSQ